MTRIIEHARRMGGGDPSASAPNGPAVPYGGTITLRFPAGVDKSACDNSSWSLELAGHSKPCSLYMSVGDPDSGTGIWFRQR
jgi:hypothetical protein